MKGRARSPMSNPLQANSPAAILILAFLALLFFSGSLPGSEGSSDFSIPSSRGLLVDPARPPQPAAAFFRKHGSQAAVYWDHRLGTPRLISPRSPVPVVEVSAGTSPSEETVAAGALAFLSENAELFGAGPGDLDDPSVRRFGDGWQLAYRQLAGGLPVRGAGLRILLQPDGTLALAGGHLLRHPQPVAVDLQGEEDARIDAEAMHGLAVRRLERQLVFPAGDPARPRPVWCLEAERPDGTAVELFLDQDGERVGELPLAAGFGGPCSQPDFNFTATGEVLGFSPDPQDIFANASNLPAPNAFPLPAVLVQNSQQNAQLTGTDGHYAMKMSKDSAIFSTVLVAGECAENPRDDPDGDGIKEILRVHSVSRCDDFFSTLLGRVNIDPQEVTSSIDFIYNESKSDVESFHLLAYHHLASFADHSRELLKKQVLPFEDFFPLKVTTRDDLPADLEVQIQEPALYVPNGTQSRICLARRKSLEAYLPATLIQHEYAHHVIHTVARTRQRNEVENDHLVEGIADALTAFQNGNPKIGFNAESDRGGFGFSLAEKAEANPPRLLPEFTRQRALIGRLLWGISNHFKEKDQAEILLYRWLAFHRTKNPAEKSFELSLALLEEVLVLDDLKAGQNTFTGADGNPLNGTPHWDEILKAFKELIKTSVPFIRGDADGSGEIDLSDAINILLYLFLGIGFPDCLSALDADGNGLLELTDAIAILDHLFITGQPFPPPFPACALAEDSPFWCKQARCP
ncbi:MAG: hypothetical protein HY717_05695 [Planctomycetes bacterium]|nr:hypothetical protein [Planctomycetota bacterium]